MGEFKSVDEILEYAIGREVEAREFYEILASRTENRHIRSMIERLVVEERQHRQVLETELIKRGRVVRDAEWVGETETYNHDEFLEAELHVEHRVLLQMAIGRESESFRLYVELAQLAETEELRETFLALAEEEARHRALFELEYESIKEGRG